MKLGIWNWVHYNNNCSPFSRFWLECDESIEKEEEEGKLGYTDNRLLVHS